MELGRCLLTPELVWGCIFTPVPAAIQIRTKVPVLALECWCWLLDPAGVGVVDVDVGSSRLMAFCAPERLIALSWGLLVAVLISWRSLRLSRFAMAWLVGHLVSGRRSSNALVIFIELVHLQRVGSVGIRVGHAAARPRPCRPPGFESLLPAF
jgi:hypothetical protein